MYKAIVVKALLNAVLIAKREELRSWTYVKLRYCTPEVCSHKTTKWGKLGSAELYKKDFGVKFLFSTLVMGDTVSDAVATLC